MRAPVSVSVIIVVLALLLLAIPVVAADWPMAKKDVAHTSYADDQLMPPLEPARVIDTVTSIVASPVIADGILYICNDTGETITAMNLSTGAVIFTRSASGPTESTPAVAGDVIVFGAYDGYVYCLRRADGFLLWKTSLNTGIYSSPLVYQGRVCIGTDYGDFYALDQGNGSVAWTLPKSPTQGSAAGDDGKVFIGTLDGNVYALDAKAGNVIWAYNTTDSLHSSPMVYNGTVYIASRSGKLYALDEDSGAVRWTANLGYNTDATPAIDPSTRTIFIGTFGGYMFAVDADNGEFKWISQYYGPIYSTAAVTRDVVYGCTQAGKLFALGTANGSELWSYNLGSEMWASPVIVDGRLYVGTMGGHLIVFRASSVVPGITATPTAVPPGSTAATTPFPGIALVLAALASAVAIIRLRK